MEEPSKLAPVVTIIGVELWVLHFFLNTGQLLTKSGTGNYAVCL